MKSKTKLMAAVVVGLLAAQGAIAQSGNKPEGAAVDRKESQNWKSGSNSDSSMKSGSSWQLPNGGDIAGYMALQMLQGGVSDSAGARKFVENKLRSGGLSDAQVNVFLQELDSQMKRNAAFAQVGGATQALLASLGAATQNLSVKADPEARELAMRSGLILIGQEQAAREFAQQMDSFRAQRRDVESGVGQALAK